MAVEGEAHLLGKISSCSCNTGYIYGRKSHRVQICLAYRIFNIRCCELITNIRRNNCLHVSLNDPFDIFVSIVLFPGLEFASEAFGGGLVVKLFVFAIDVGIVVYLFHYLFGWFVDYAVHQHAVGVLLLHFLKLILSVIIINIHLLLQFQFPLQLPGVFSNHNPALGTIFR